MSMSVGSSLFAASPSAPRMDLFAELNDEIARVAADVFSRVRDTLEIAAEQAAQSINDRLTSYEADVSMKAVQLTGATCTVTVGFQSNCQVICHLLHLATQLALFPRSGSLMNVACQTGPFSGWPPSLALPPSLAADGSEPDALRRSSSKGPLPSSTRRSSSKGPDAPRRSVYPSSKREEATGPRVGVRIGGGSFEDDAPRRSVYPSSKREEATGPSVGVRIGGGYHVFRVPERTVRSDAGSASLSGTMSSPCLRDVAVETVRPDMHSGDHWQGSPRGNRSDGGASPRAVFVPSGAGGSSSLNSPRAAFTVSGDGAAELTPRSHSPSQRSWSPRARNGTNDVENEIREHKYALGAPCEASQPGRFTVGAYVLGATPEQVLYDQKVKDFRADKSHRQLEKEHEPRSPWPEYERPVQLYRCLKPSPYERDAARGPSTPRSGQRNRSPPPRTTTGTPIVGRGGALSPSASPSKRLAVGQTLPRAHSPAGLFAPEISDAYQSLVDPVRPSDSPGISAWTVHSSEESSCKRGTFFGTFTRNTASSGANGVAACVSSSVVTDATSTSAAQALETSPRGGYHHDSTPPAPVAAYAIPPRSLRRSASAAAPVSFKYMSQSRASLP